MPVSENIERVLQKIGTEVRIIKHDDSDPTLEYIDYEINPNDTAPFYGQHMIESTFGYNTNADPGDLVEFVDDGSKYLIVSSNKTRFKNKLVTIESVLYKCNITGDIKRKQTTGRDDNYNLIEEWNTIASGESALFVGDINDRSVDSQDYAEIYTMNPNLFISGDVDVQSDDRFEVSADEKYQIKSIEPRRLENVKICRVEKDNRE